MAIIDTVTEVSFQDTMINHGFSREGATALFWHLDDVSEGGGQDIEMDPIAFRCEFSEYEDFQDLKDAYDIEDIEELKDKTLVIPFEGYDLEAKKVIPKGWVVQEF